MSNTTVSLYIIRNLSSVQIIIALEDDPSPDNMIVIHPNSVHTYNMTNAQYKYVQNKYSGTLKISKSTWKE